MGEKNVIGRRENAVWNAKTFRGFVGTASNQAMTVRGAVNKATILLAIVALSATWGWLSIAHDLGFGGFSSWLVLVLAAALAVGLITSIYKRAACYTAPLYAFLEGVLLGGVSALFEAKYPGLVIQAVFLTFGTLFGLLVLYRASGLHVTARFRAGVFAAVLAILLVYLANIFLRLLGMWDLPFLHQNNLIGLIFSLFVVVVAALNLVLDFDLIEQGAIQGAPKYMEWYAAFGLLVTLVWLYLEILEFLMRLAFSSDED